MKTLSQKEITQLTNNWKKALPVSLGNLFSYVRKDEKNPTIERYDTYQLNTENIGDLLECSETIKNHEKNIQSNVETIAVKMGLKKDNSVKAFFSSEPDELEFQPILDIQLKNKTKYCFLLHPNPKPFKIGIKNSNSDITNLQQISPKVAELFILKWQCLTDSQLIDAFEGLTPSSTKIVNTDEGRESTAEIVFGTQSVKRVNQFVFDEAESKQIMETLVQNYNANKQKTYFYIHLGAGLVVPDFHPFDFRPIIKIAGESPKNIVAATDGGLGATYFDTSTPCPPFCGRPPKTI